MKETTLYYEKVLYYAQLVLIAVSAAALGYAIGAGDAGGDAGVAPMVAVFAGAFVAILGATRGPGREEGGSWRIVGSGENVLKGGKGA